jgi:hypothetical protein
MSTQADSFVLSPLIFGEAFFAGAAAMQRQIAEGMLAVFDAVADVMSDSLRAGAELAHEIGNAQTPIEAVASSHAWLQERVEKSFSWLLASATRLPFPSAPVAQPAEPTLLPSAPPRRAPVVPQVPPRMATKPPAGKLRSAASIVVDKLPKKPARPAAK